MQLLKNFRVHPQNSTLQQVSFAPKVAFPTHSVYAGAAETAQIPTGAEMRKGWFSLRL